MEIRIVDNKYYFIVNMSGGSGRVRKIWHNVKHELNVRGIDYKAFKTENAEHAKNLAYKLSKLNEDNINIVVVGGDGTINACLNGIDDFKKVIFGVIPSGSANDFARGLGIPKDCINALDIILSDKPYKKIDIGQITINDEKRLFGISSGIGLDAIVCKKALSSKIKNVLNKVGLGSLTYLILTVISLFTMDYIDTEIEIYDKEDNLSDTLKFNRMIFAAFMNVQAEGGGVPMAPDAKFDDGKLSLCIASDISKLSAFAKLPLLVMAKQEKIKGFKLLDANKVIVRVKEPSVLHADGEYVGDETDVKIECLCNILNMKY
ncbi:MAG: YegS/Rv2252/BmrU family lipid kinase [Lachnospiraceae bacterium]|nr:YegS/Rv2252/BmrU family lipid kinase [Lachnospiraceae bacterium]